jgi:photosystem II stability/assembly factor-like uncharacterized protein
MPIVGLFGKSEFRFAICVVLATIIVMPTGAQPPSTSYSPRLQGRRPNPLQSYRQQFYLPRGEAKIAGGHTLQSHEDPFGRASWFRLQRSYPFPTIPQNARRNAYMDALQSQSALKDSGLFKFTLPKWMPIGPAPVNSYGDKMRPTSGRINCIAISPTNQNIVLIGAATGGIWRSTDAGAHFAHVADNQADLAVGYIAFAPSDPQIVYAGMGDWIDNYYGTGVLKSTDAGHTWQLVSNSTLPTPGTTAKILVDTRDPQRLYLVQYSYQDPQNSGGPFASGFFYSKDGGINWIPTKAGLPADLAITPDSKSLLLAMDSTPDIDKSAGIYSSPDQGVTWSAIYTPSYKTASDMRVAVTPAAPCNIYVLTGVTDQNGVVTADLAISTDAGATWITKPLKNIDLGQFGYNTVLAVSSVSAATIYIGTRDLWKSTDGGVTWTNLTGNYVRKDDSYDFTLGGIAHSDQHALVFSNPSSEVFLLANDGGLYRSKDGGHSCESLNATLTITEMNSIAVRANDATFSYGGTQDNGAVRRSTVDEWSEFDSGDCGVCVLDPSDPHGLFATYIYGQIDHFGSDGSQYIGSTSSATFGEPQTSPRIGFYAPFTADAASPTLYFGTWRLFKSTDGAKWVPTSKRDLTMKEVDPQNDADDVLSAIAIGPPHTGIIYTGSAYGRVMYSNNSGASWSDVTTGLTQRFVKSITVDPKDHMVVYITFSGFHSGHVYMTNNNGGRWVDISANLPDLPVNALLVDPVTPTTLYVGTDIGVWVSTDRKQPWRYLSDGLPPVIVTGIVATKDSTLRISTYGRGAFELKRPGTL